MQAVCGVDSDQGHGRGNKSLVPSRPGFRAATGSWAVRSLLFPETQHGVEWAAEAHMVLRGSISASFRDPVKAM